MTELELHEAIAEAESLAEAMRNVSADGRLLAAELAKRITELVDVQCGAIDARIDTVDQRIASLRRRIAA